MGEGNFFCNFSVCFHNIHRKMPLMKKIITIIAVTAFIILFSTHEGQAELSGSNSQTQIKPAITKYVKNAQQSEKARLKYMMWDVYDATLLTSNGNYQHDEPFALTLDYLIDLKGKKIAERSIVEMRKQGISDAAKLEEWENILKDIFPNVEKGNSITGIRDKNGYTIFFKNNTKIGQIEDPKFTKHFFDIWLGSKTSEPEMRQQLLGLR